MFTCSWTEQIDMAGHAQITSLFVYMAVAEGSKAPSVAAAPPWGGKDSPHRPSTSSQTQSSTWPVFSAVLPGPDGQATRTRAEARRRLARGRSSSSRASTAALPDLVIGDTSFCVSRSQVREWTFAYRLRRQKKNHSNAGNLVAQLYGRMGWFVQCLVRAPRCV